MPLHPANDDRAQLDPSASALRRDGIELAAPPDGRFRRAGGVRNIAGALHDDGKSTGLWVLDPATSSVSFRTVQVRRLAAEAAIVDGVRSGERVVALGAHLLHQGERVRGAEQTATAR